MSKTAKKLEPTAPMASHLPTRWQVANSWGVVPFGRARVEDTTRDRPGSPSSARWRLTTRVTAYETLTPVAMPPSRS